MVSLEQIRALEARVEKAVGLIEKLRKENAELEQRLDEAVRSEEKFKTAYSELERRAAGSSRTAAESAARIEELGAKLREAEERTKESDLRAAEAAEKAAALERKTGALEAESAGYRDRALAAEHRASELEARAEELKRDQMRIEEGLSQALNKLDAFEDLVMGISVGSADAPDIADAAKAETIGESKVEAVEESPSTPASQDNPFPGAKDELDIF